MIAGPERRFSREYLAIFALCELFAGVSGAAYMIIAKELEVHANEELAHALAVANHID